MNEKKEFLLNLVDKVSIWRAELLERYPDDRNRVAAESLAKLYDYIENLKDDHPLLDLNWRWNTYEQLIEKMNDELRMYGYRNTFETPEQFVKRFIQDAIDQTLMEETDREYGEEYGIDDEDEEDYSYNNDEQYGNDDDEKYGNDDDEKYGNDDDEVYGVVEDEEY